MNDFSVFFFVICVRCIAIRGRQTTIQRQLDLLGERPRPPPLMLDDSTDNPVVLHAQVALPHPTNLSFSINTPGGIQPHRDVPWAKHVFIAIAFRHPEGFLRRRPDIFVSESCAPNHCVNVQGTAIRKANPGLGVAYGRNTASHGYLPFSNKLGAADVDVMTAAALN